MRSPALNSLEIEGSQKALQVSGEKKTEHPKEWLAVICETTMNRRQLSHPIDKPCNTSHPKEWLAVICETTMNRRQLSHPIDKPSNTSR
ncbi:unnamed protein product [Oppiella nova]|uniref:Uncharacterized protein n=1 Tax=Oppiella nova TaxID=334625 RepID=A0A7R9QET5_9ACAR|nr:unnamed protein product [Oppiella nova]CAG2164375.1 unnamed protein product [Oppiella nova]